MNTPLQPKPCSRCHARPASTLRTAYCKSCRAEYQREWRRRRREIPEPPELPPCPENEPRHRLRGTPTMAELLRFRLL